MKQWIAVGAGVLIAFAIVQSWPEMVRYRRMMSM